MRFRSSASIEARFRLRDESDEIGESSAMTEAIGELKKEKEGDGRR